MVRVWLGYRYVTYGWDIRSWGICTCMHVHIHCSWVYWACIYEVVGVYIIIYLCDMIVCTMITWLGGCEVVGGIAM